MIDSDKEWEKLGRSDPYYGVLSYEKFRKQKLEATSLAEFFDSGRDHINRVLEIIRHYVDPKFAPSSALDFGCGVGRCTLPLARVCRSVTGVDVSESMLDESANNLHERRISNVSLIKTDELLSQPLEPFDLIHSVLVFQHVPQNKGEKILERLLCLLANRGVLAIHILYHKSDPGHVQILGELRKRLPLLHNLTNLLYGKSFTEPLMEKNIYDTNRLLFLLHNYGFSDVHMTFMPEGSLHGMLLLCQKH